MNSIKNFFDIVWVILLSVGYFFSVIFIAIYVAIKEKISKL